MGRARPCLNEALKRLAAEAATRFTTLVASGDQIPFDVDEQAGPDSPLPQLRAADLPLRARARGRAALAARLRAGARRGRRSPSVAAPYLEARGETVAADPGERAAQMLTVFIASLWDGCTEFSLDRDRLDSALAVLDAEAAASTRPTS